MFLAFDLGTRFAPQRCALLQHLKFQLTSKRVSHHSGVQFLISHTTRWLRTRPFVEPTFQSSKTTKHWKITVFRDFSIFHPSSFFFYTSFGESSSTGHSGSVLPGGSKHQLCAKVHAVSSILCAPLDAFDAYALSASKPSALWSIHARELSDTGDDSFRTNLPLKQNMRPLASQEKQWWLRLAIKKSKNNDNCHTQLVPLSLRA